MLVYIMYYVHWIYWATMDYNGIFNMIVILDMFRYHDIIAWEYDSNLMNMVHHGNIKYPGWKNGFVWK